MKNLFTASSSRAYLIGLLAVPIVALVILEVLLRVYIVPIPNTTPNRVHKVYTAKGGDVVVGDSQIYYAYQSSDQSFVNLGQGGTSIATLEILIREYFRHRKPGRVILQAAPHRIRPYKPRNYDRFFSQNIGLPFVPYVFEPGVTYSIDKLFDPAGLANLRREKENTRTQAAAWARKTQEERWEQALERVRWQRPIWAASSVQSIKSYLSTIRFLLDRGAQVCLLRMPVSQEYQALIEGDEHFDKALTFFESTAKHAGIPYVDFRDLPMRYDANIFINPDHLTATAGKRFFALVEPACFGPG